MKEVGLMFKAPLVRAILNGHKTQTRRLIDPQPFATNVGVGDDGWLWNWLGKACPMLNYISRTTMAGQMAKYAPYSAGDRIYVREAFSQSPRLGRLAFRADGEKFQDADGWLLQPKWKPSHPHA